MKNILMILAALGLTACSQGIVKNEAGVPISVAGNKIDNGKCHEWTVFLGIFGDSEVAIKTWGDAEGFTPEQIGNKAAYEVGYYVVNNTTKEEGAVTSSQEAPNCEPPPAEDPVAAAKKAAVEAAGAAVKAAEAIAIKAQGLQSPGHPAPAEKKAEILKQVTAVKTKAEAVKKQADDADTVEKAKAAEAEAKKVQAEAEAITW